MPLELYTPHRGDVPYLSALAFAAYATDPGTAMLYPVPAPPSLIASSTANMLASWGQNPQEHLLCVRDTSLPTLEQPGGEIVSWAHWFVEPTKDGEEWKVFKDPIVPDGWNGAFFREFRRKDWEARVRTMGSQAHVYFLTLVTEPSHRRRGAGSKLVQAMRSFANAANLPVYLTASPAGASLYRSLGFVETGSYMLDIADASGDQPVRTNLCMHLPAPSPSEPPSLLPPRIVPCTSLEHFTNFMRVHDEAMGNSELMSLAFKQNSDTGPKMSHEERAQKELDATAKSQEPENKGKYWFLNHQAVDELSGRALGFAKWYFASDPSYPHKPFGDEWPPYANKALCEATFGEMNRRREKRMAGQQYALMCLLVVAPEHQRKGVGAALLREGLRAVDDMGWKTWIDATPFGAGLYRKMGWRECERLKTDLKEWGGKGLDVSLSLLREPGEKGER